MKPHVYSVFAGLGKTHLGKINPDKFVDLESSDYQWLKDTSKTKEELKGTVRVKNEHFPWNYTKAIKENLGKGKHVLISCQPEVLDHMAAYGYPFTTVYPSKESKKEIVQRYKDRKNPKSFVDLMSRNYEKFTNDLRNNPFAFETIEVEKGEYLSDILGGM